MLRVTAAVLGGMIAVLRVAASGAVVIVAPMFHLVAFPSILAKAHIRFLSRFFPPRSYPPLVGEKPPFVGVIVELPQQYQPTCR